MKTIETTITVLPDGSIQIPPRPDLPSGEHRAVLVVDEARLVPPLASEREPLRLKMIDMPGWPIDARFRREDLYDDDGR